VTTEGKIRVDPPHPQATACPWSFPEGGLPEALPFPPRFIAPSAASPAWAETTTGRRQEESARAATGCAPSGRALILVEKVLAHQAAFKSACSSALTSAFPARRLTRCCGSGQVNPWPADKGMRSRPGLESGAGADCLRRVRDH
jgi:hypothetical protein